MSHGIVNVSRELLTDGSHVYNVTIDTAEDKVIIACASNVKADYLFEWLMDSANVVDITGIR